LGPIDITSIGRDSLLRWILVLPLGVALGARLVLPTFLERLSTALGVDLLQHYAALVGVELLVFAPALAGMVVGFLLLDQRDDRSLLALLVSPLPVSVFIVYRLAMPVAVSLVLTLITFPLAGIMEPGVTGALISALAAAPLAPMMALVLGGFAENKVQGFALVKALGIVLPAPLIVYLVDEPWTVALALVPTYWPAQVYWAVASGASPPWLTFTIGMSYQVLLLAVLLRRFERTMHSGL
jgi:fluoroquinolone transport system permease protein